MMGGLGARLPDKQLRELDFLIGDGTGPGIMCPPGRSPVQFTGHLHVEREHCERFVRLEFFGIVPSMGMESIHSLITYSEKHHCYRMWNFASSCEEPMVMDGDFQGSSLVFVSDPTEMLWGTQRMRCAFTSLGDGVVDYKAELWTIEGYVPYFRATYCNAATQVYGA